MIDDRRVGAEPGLPEVPAPATGEPAEAGPLLRAFRDQRVAFVLVGGLNTGINLVAFIVLARFLQLWGGDAAVLAAQGIAIPSAFVLHRRFVFRVTGHVLRDLGRFVVVNVIPVSVNLAVLPLLTTVFGWPQLPSQIAFTVGWVLCSYFLHRGFSFRRTKGERMGRPDGGHRSRSDDPAATGTDR